MGNFMPKTTIFCNTLTDIAFMFNYLLFTLERFAYYLLYHLKDLLIICSKLNKKRSYCNGLPVL